MVDTLTDFTTLVICTCPACGVRHAIPADLNHQAKLSRGQLGRQIYCPNGHSWHYTGKTDADREREAREAAERQVLYLQNRRTELETRLEHAKHEIRGQKAAKTRIKNRIAKGVCPCCNRTFQDLQRHMTTQHPEFAKVETP